MSLEDRGALGRAGETGERPGPPLGKGHTAVHPPWMSCHVPAAKKLMAAGRALSYRRGAVRGGNGPLEIDVVVLRTNEEWL